MRFRYVNNHSRDGRLVDDQSGHGSLFQVVLRTMNNLQIERSNRERSPVPRPLILESVERSPLHFLEILKYDNLTLGRPFFCKPSNERIKKP